MVTQPTRQDHVLDLFLISNPTLVTDVTILPGLGDHDIVQAEVAVKPTQVNQKHRRIHLYNKADWTTFRSKLKAYQIEILWTESEKSVDQLWSGLTEKLDKLTDECIPSKVIKGKPSLPWVSHEIKRLIRKTDKCYKSHRKTGNPQMREKYLSLRHTIRRRIKDSHDRSIS